MQSISLFEYFYGMLMDKGRVLWTLSFPTSQLIEVPKLQSFSLFEYLYSITLGLQLR